MEIVLNSTLEHFLKKGIKIKDKSVKLQKTTNVNTSRYVFLNRLHESIELTLGYTTPQKRVKIK